MAYKLNMTGQEFEQRIKNPQPVNLLDNSDFRNPVNQRGVSSKTGLTWSFILDRWYISLDNGITATLTGKGISCNGDYFIQQRFPLGYLNPGKAYTCVRYYADGTTEIDGIPQVYGDEFCYISIYVPATARSLAAVALYEGEYTVDTLPEYQPKGYAAELAECQRYYYRNNLPNVLPGFITSNAKRLYIDIILPAMRTTPSLINPLPQLTIRTVTGYSSIANNTSPYGTPTSQVFAKYNSTGGQSSIYFQFDAEIGTNNTPAVAQVRNNGYLEFSADF